MRTPIVSLLSFVSFLSAAYAQTPPPDAGALRQQIEQQQKTRPLPKNSAPLRLDNIAPLTLKDDVSVTVKVFRFTGNTLLDEDMLRGALTPWVDRPIRFIDLQRVTRVVADIYREAGWIVSTYLPQQDVTDGSVIIGVTEASFADAIIDGPTAKRLRSQVAFNYVRAQQTIGQTLSASALDRALLLINDLPGVSVTGALAPGRRIGETELVLQLNDSSTFNAIVHADNSGARSTGQQRAVLTALVNSPLRIGDRIRSDLLHTEGSDYARLVYTLPVGAKGWQLGINGSYFEYELTAPEFTALEGEGSSNSIGVSASYPLLRSRVRNLYLTLSADEQRFKNEALNLEQSDYAITALNLGMTGNLYDGFGGGGANTFSVTWTGGRLRQGALDLAEDPRLSGTFSKLTYSLSRQQALISTLSLYGAINGQFANEALDSSERFYLGGPEGVRAYPVNDGGGSRSEMATLELRWLAHRDFTATFFDDWGHVDNRNDEDDYTLRGYGLSLEWRVPFGVQLEATYALRQGSNPNPAANGLYQDGSRSRNRWWIGATATFY